MRHFVLSVWCGADSYIEAARNSADRAEREKGSRHDFFRINCKRIQTVRKYIRRYVEQVKGDSCMEYLYPFFVREDGRYTITYSDSEEILENGFIKDIV